MKRAIELGAVQETLFIPLYSRAVEARKKRGLLFDRKAVEMVDAIDYDFRKFDNSLTLLVCVVRTSILDEWIKQFLARHPEGTVVEIGAGLNTRFERLDNGKVRWFDLDLPDAMDLRKTFFAESDRRKLLSASILDDEWIATVKQSPGPYFFAIEAVLVYLSKADVLATLERMVRAFPGSQIAFDTANQFSLDRQHRHDVMKKMEAKFAWACNDPRELESLGLRLLDSHTIVRPPDAIRSRMPFTRRGLLSMLQLLFPKTSASYKVNLFET